MKETVTIPINTSATVSTELFRKFDIIKASGGPFGKPVWNIVSGDVKESAPGSYTIPLRKLNTSRLWLIRKIQLWSIRKLLSA